MQPSTQDIQPSFDPSGQTTISGAQLLQLISGAHPLTGIGFFLVTVDVGATATVPDAITNTKWQAYGWIRVQVSSVTLYLWNPNGGNNNDPNTGQNLSQWYSVTLASIPDGSITNQKLANLAVTDSKINDVSWGKVTGAPTFVVSGSAVGGVLSGTLPNPGFAPGAISGASIGTRTVIHSNLQTQTGDDSKASVPNANTLTAPVNPANNLVVATGAASGDILAVTAGTDGFVPVTKQILSVAPVALNPLRGNAAGTAYEEVTVDTLLLARSTFTSAETALNIAGAQLLDTAHGLGALPKNVSWVLVCKTIDCGYAVGDELPISFLSNGISAPSLTGGANATNVFIAETASATNNLIHKTTGALTAFNAANWRVKCYARL